MMPNVKEQFPMENSTIRVNLNNKRKKFFERPRAKIIILVAETPKYLFLSTTSSGTHFVDDFSTIILSTPSLENILSTTSFGKEPNHDEKII